MKKTLLSGMFLFLAMAAMVSCTQENVMLETTPQVKNQEVRFSFFESSIVPIGQGEGSNLARTRAGEEAKSLKDAQLYTELEVCLIPKGDNITAGYTARQESTEDNFGNVSLNVPPGEYTLVAAAVNTNMELEERMNIKNRSEMTFANNIVRDMAYCYQDIKVVSGSQAVSQNVSLKRGVSCFVLNGNDKPTLNGNSYDITVSGNCGYVFNPSTGFCKEKANIARSWTFDPKKYQTKHLGFDVFVLLGADDVTNLQVTAESKDKEGKAIKTCSFDNVHLVIGKKTIYTGPLYTYKNGMSFSISEPTMPKSDYGKVFQ